MLTEINTKLKLASVTKILRNIRAITFTDNYGKLRMRGMSARVG